MVRKMLTKSSVIGLNTYTADAKYLGKVVDFGVDLQNPSNVTIIIEGKDKRYVVPVSYIKAVGDIIILAENTPLEELAESKPSTQVSTQPTTTVTTVAPAAVSTPSYPTTQAQQPIQQPSTQPVIPRCPTCGTALIYYPQYGRWYCPRCRKYTEVPPAVLSRVPRCPTCGNYLSYIEQYRKWYCYKCGKYVNV